MDDSAKALTSTDTRSNSCSSCRWDAAGSQDAITGCLHRRMDTDITQAAAGSEDRSGTTAKRFFGASLVTLESMKKFGRGGHLDDGHD